MVPLVLAASVRGAAHERAGKPCEDALAWIRLPAGGIALALADGAGSAPLGRQGARAAADGAVAGVRRACDAPDLGACDVLARAGALAARALLEAAAASARAPLRALACTLLVVVWRPAAAAAAHVGDGAAVGARPAPEGFLWTVLSAPAPTEYVNETRFLSDPDWGRALRVSPPARGLAGVAAFTDGCERAALRRAPGGGPEAFAGFLAPLGRFAARGPDPPDGERRLAALLDAPKLRAISDDDRTLALIWERHGGG